ncbi:hypothetical protein [Treponema sp. R80B11-R83G3]
MKRIILFVLMAGLFVINLAAQQLTQARMEVNYNISDSVDNIGNLYIRYNAYLPSVLTFVNNNGSVTVCSSDAKNTYIYEYDINLKEQKTLSFQNELGSLGAFTKDGDGNYYFFYGIQAVNQNMENMAMVKYDKDGEKIKTYKLKAQAPNSFDGIKNPFRSGTCRLELSSSMLAVYFSRLMFSGHQASYGFVLDKDTFERIDKGAATNAERNGGYLEMPYVSHSFNEFILPIDNGFVFADHGDAYPRSFTFAKFLNKSATKRVHAFGFPGAIGANATYAEMGGLAKTSDGYIFAGTYGREINNPRNLFVLTFDENMSSCSAPIYLTKYTRNDGHAGHPKIVQVDTDRYLLLWEVFKFSTQAANIIESVKTEYLSTYMLLIDEKGKAISEPQELKGIRLNINDTLRFNPHNGKVYWAINEGSNSIIVYALEIGG